MTIKEIRKSMRSLKSGEILEVDGWGKIQKFADGYGIVGVEDNSDPYHDYCDWTFGWKEKWVLENIQKELGI